MANFKINVVNKYRESNHVYCGRGTPLGNPFFMKDESSRGKVCDKFEEYFYEKVIKQKDKEMINHLKKIWDKGKKDGIVNLGCFCSPKRCHCDTIKNFLESKMEKSND